MEEHKQPQDLVHPLALGSVLLAGKNHDTTRVSRSSVISDHSAYEPSTSRSKKLSAENDELRSSHRAAGKQRLVGEVEVQALAEVQGCCLLARSNPAAGGHIEPFVRPGQRGVPRMAQRYMLILGWAM